MKIKNVKFSYVESKYKLGPYVEFLAELEVPSTDYSCIVSVIEESHPEYEQVEIMSFYKG